MTTGACGVERARSVALSGQVVFVIANPGRKPWADISGHRVAFAPQECGIIGPGLQPWVIRELMAALKGATEWAWQILNIMTLYKCTLISPIYQGRSYL